MSTSAGRQLSNVAWNWSQDVGKVLTERDCKMLRELADLFDAEHRAAKAAAPRSVPLTLAQLDNIRHEVWPHGVGKKCIPFARAIEAAHGIGKESVGG